MKKALNKKAFTLVEVIVAFSVLILVILASTDLLVTVIRSNTANVNTLVAYGLAQEGLEVVRNIRDTDWLLGADFQGKVDGTCLWRTGVCLPQTTGVPQFFALMLHPNPTSFNSINPLLAVDTGGIATYSPWELFNIPRSSGKTYTQLYLPGSASKLSSVGSALYQPCFGSTNCPNSNKNPSIFLRYIEVEALRGGTKIQKYRVSSVVTWVEQALNKQVVLTTELTNWKGGPL